jgi:hypothetical protein
MQRSPDDRGLREPALRSSTLSAGLDTWSITSVTIV